jgi:tetratricopeptide (TPR) repeat protein
MARHPGRRLISLFSATLAAWLLLSPTPGMARPEPTGTTTGNRELSSREVHQVLIRGCGWVHNNGPKGLTFGTAWIIDLDRRLMITNAHVVEGVDVVAVVFPEWKDGKLVREEAAYQTALKRKAEVIDRDDNRDLALLRVESIPAGMHAIRLATTEPDEGDDIRTIGAFTRGGDGLLWGSVSGNVRTVGPQPGRLGRSVRKVLSNANTNGGNSGAPVVNMSGELVAVHAALKTNANGVAVHIASAELRAFMKEALPGVEPQDAAAFIARGKRRHASHRYEVAIADFDAALERDPGSSVSLCLRGKAFLARGDFAKALKDLNAAVEAEPENYEYRLARGIALRTTGDHSGSLQDLTAAIDLSSARMDAYNERGITHIRMKKYHEAEQDFGRAIALAERDPQLHANRAVARARLEKFEEAVQDWKNAAKLAPRNPAFANSLGLALAQMGKFDDALVEIRRAVQLSGNNPVYLTSLGEVQSRAGKHKDAANSFSQALSILGDNGLPLTRATAFAGRGTASRHLELYRDAIDDLSKAIDLTQGKVAAFYLERARVHKARGDDAAAARDIAAAANLDPTSAPAAPRTVTGTWKGAYVVNGLQVVQVINFQANGTFEGTFHISSRARAASFTDSGTYTLENDTLTIRSKQNGACTRKLVWNGDEVDVEMAEIGTVVRFSRVK